MDDVANCIIDVVWHGRRVVDIGEVLRVHVIDAHLQQLPYVAQSEREIAGNLPTGATQRMRRAFQKRCYYTNEWAVSLIDKKTWQTQNVHWKNTPRICDWLICKITNNNKQCVHTRTDVSKGVILTGQTCLQFGSVQFGSLWSHAVKTTTFHSGSIWRRYY